MEIVWRPRSKQGEHLYVLDGDTYTLRPGIDFVSTMSSMRAKLHRMCKERGLRYRSQVLEGNLIFEAYREVPGDLLNLDEDPYAASRFTDNPYVIPSPADAPPGPAN
jgi:hypothetical protein